MGLFATNCWLTEAEVTPFVLFALHSPGLSFLASWVGQEQVIVQSPVTEYCDKHCSWSQNTGLLARIHSLEIMGYNTGIMIGSHCGTSQRFRVLDCPQDCFPLLGSHKLRKGDGPNDGRTLQHNPCACLWINTLKFSLPESPLLLEQFWVVQEKEPSADWCKCYIFSQTDPCVWHFLVCTKISSHPLLFTRQWNPVWVSKGTVLPLRRPESSFGL